MSLTQFLLAYAMLVVMPGPNLLVVLQSASEGGRRAAVAAAQGVVVGATGLSALILAAGRHLPTSGGVMPWLQLVFAALLIRGGLGCFRLRPAGCASVYPAGLAGLGGAGLPGRAAFLRAVPIAMSNPFTALFFLSATLAIEAGGGAARMPAIPPVVALTAGVWFGLVALAATSAGLVRRFAFLGPQMVSRGLGLALLAMGVNVASGVLIR